MARKGQGKRGYTLVMLAAGSWLAGVWPAGWAVLHSDSVFIIN